MTRLVPIDTELLSRVMFDALTALRDGTRYTIMPVTRRALTRRGFAKRVARESRDGRGITAASGYEFVITDAGRAAIDAATVAT
jgi:hypothetical protein